METSSWAAATTDVVGTAAANLTSLRAVPILATSVVAVPNASDATDTNDIAYLQLGPQRPRWVPRSKAPDYEH